MALEDLRVSGKDDFRDGDIVQVTDARLTVRQQVHFIRGVEKREGCLLANGLREPRVPSLDQAGKQLELISEPLAFHRERADPCGRSCKPSAMTSMSAGSSRRAPFST